MYSPESSLAPEFRRAFQFLIAHLEDTVVDTRTIKRDVYLQGAVKKLPFRITPRDLPNASGWIWNQAQAKSFIDYPEEKLKVVLSKLVSRKRPELSISAPSYKLWSYEVSNENGYMFNMLWCEKGEMRDLTNPHHITIKDFQFLGEFMNPSIAAQFWPSFD